VPSPIDIGLFPLGLVLLPGERVPLHLFEPRYRQLAADCILDDVPFVVLLSAEGGTARVGCTARFEALLRRFADGRMNVTVQGGEPVEVVEETEGRMYLTARVRVLEDRPSQPAAEELEDALGLFRSLTEQVTGVAADPEVPEGVPLSYALAGAVDLGPEPKQELLESRDEAERLSRVRRILRVAKDGIDRSRAASERAQMNGKVNVQ
jgi:ATP-dependent Lon protease